MLNDALQRQVAAAYGVPPLPAVAVQAEQLRLRLRAFADKQAAWAAEGWRIEHVEVPETAQAVPFPVDDVPLGLRGRVDRIDVHRQTNERVLLDYKSGDAGDPPEKVHRTGGQWVDLQLPLYRHLVHGLGLAGPLRLGFVVLPKDPEDTAFRLADWSEQDLREADEVACQVVRDIRAERFCPRQEPPPDYSQDFAPICQDGVFEREMPSSG